MTSRERRIAKAQAIQRRQDMIALAWCAGAILVACLPVFLM